MTKHLLLLTSLLLATTGIAKAEDFARTAVSGPETWKRYEVRGFRLGTPRSVLKSKGFTCGKRANSRCYKIMDKRCETGRCEFKEDAFGQWFELNGAKTSLDFITIATTETDSALAYDLHLYFGPRMLLTNDSPLGKALIQKYGTPTDGNDEVSTSDPAGGGRMLWRNTETGNNGPEIIVDCDDGSSEHARKQCDLDVTDYGIVAVERAKQEDRDKKKMRASQPQSAPEL